MAVKRYDGSQWVTVAGKGDQGPSSSISTWVKTVTGGETSVSGNDDNSQPLSYTVGQELVFINGALQKRGADYTATTGNSITGLTALAANDVVTVWTVNAFSVTNAISNTLVDAKGDILTATSADVPARLAVGANNTVLTADSSTATGLKWAAVSAPSYTWTSFTPSWVGLTIGNASVSAFYLQIDKIVYVIGKVIMGSTTTFTSGNFGFTPPVTQSQDDYIPSFVAAFFDDSASIWYNGMAREYTGDIYFTVGKTDATYLTQTNVINTVPFTWAVSDQLAFSGFYKAA